MGIYFHAGNRCPLINELYEANWNQPGWHRNIFCKKYIYLGNILGSTVLSLDANLTIQAYAKLSEADACMQWQKLAGTHNGISL